MGGILGGGAGSGGPLGMAGMDLSLHKIPILGTFFQNPNEQHMQQQQHQAARAFGQYRPEMQQAKMNAMKQTAMAMQPVQNAMASMYGSAFTGQDPSVFNSPMGPSMMGVGQEAPGMQTAGPPGQEQGQGGGKMGGLPGMEMMGGLPGMPPGLPGMGGGMPPGFPGLPPGFPGMGGGF